MVVDLLMAISWYWSLLLVGSWCWFLIVAGCGVGVYLYLVYGFGFICNWFMVLVYMIIMTMYFSGLYHYQEECNGRLLLHGFIPLA